MLHLSITYAFEVILVNDIYRVEIILYIIVYTGTNCWPYKSGINLLFCWFLDLRKWWWILYYGLNLKVCHVCNCYIVNSTKNRGNSLLVFENSYPIRRNSHSLIAEWMKSSFVFTFILLSNLNKVISLHSWTTLVSRLQP